jgi:hypothetical protein
MTRKDDLLTEHQRWEIRDLEQTKHRLRADVRNAAAMMAMLKQTDPDKAALIGEKFPEKVRAVNHRISELNGKMRAIRQFAAKRGAR